MNGLVNNSILGFSLPDNNPNGKGILLYSNISIFNPSITNIQVIIG